MAFVEYAGHFEGAMSDGAPFLVQRPINTAVGDLLVLQIIRLGGAQTFTLPSGWTELENGSTVHDNSEYGGTDGQFTHFWKVADIDDVTNSSGGWMTVSSSVTSPQRKAYQFMRFTGDFSGGPIPILCCENVSSGSGGSVPNSPEFTPAGGAKDYLWCTSVTTSNYHLISLWPTGYTEARTSVIGGNPCRIAFAGRELNATTEDPGAWTGFPVYAPFNVAWSAFTIVIFEPVTVPEVIPAGPCFITETDTTHYDFVELYGEAEKDYASYFLTGAAVHGEGHKSGNIEYLTVFANVEEDASIRIRGKWDWANSSSSGKWSTEQEGYTVNRENRDVSRKRLLLRGSGPALQLHFRSVAGKPFDLIGWTTQESIDGTP